MIADRLAHAVGAAHVVATEHGARVTPGAPAELGDVVRIAGEVGAVVGVGVTRGIQLDLSRMRNLLELDETSLLCTAQAGITVAALERLLAERGLQLPPLPSWSRDRTLGALLAAPRPSEASPRAGRFVRACAGVQALLPDGTELATRVAPRKATGPDLLHAVVGTRGAIGLITAATVRVERRQEVRASAAFRLKTLPGALASARTILVCGGRPTNLSVCENVLLLDADGPEPLVSAEMALAAAVTREHGGEPTPHAPPPRVTVAPHERAVAFAALEHERPLPEPGDTLRFVGWHPGGAAVVDTTRAPVTPPPPPLVGALKAQLDPRGLFPTWEPRRA